MDTDRIYNLKDCDRYTEAVAEDLAKVEAEVKELRKAAKALAKRRAQLVNSEDERAMSDCLQHGGWWHDGFDPADDSKCSCHLPAARRVELRKALDLTGAAKESFFG